MNGEVWLEQLPCSVMVCDKRYRILYMNDKAARDHAEDGGKTLVGTNLMDCHPPESRVKLNKIMASGQPNVYTTQRKKAKKLVYQCRWRKGERVGGLVQLVIEIPRGMPNFVRA